MLPDDILTVFQRLLADLTGPVTIDFVQSGAGGLHVPGRVQQPCPDCPAVRETLEQIAGISDALQLRIHEFSLIPELAAELGVDRVPAIVIRGPSPTPQRASPLRIFGNPLGQLLPPLLDALARSGAPADPPPPELQAPELQAIVEQLTHPPSLRVMASVKDKHGAQAGITAFTLAALIPGADASIYAMESFPQLVHDLEMTHTPLTFVNDSRGFAGATSVPELAQYALSSQIDRDNTTPPRVTDGSLGSVERTGGRAQAPPEPGVIVPDQDIWTPAPKPTATPGTIPTSVTAELPHLDVAIIGGGPAGMQAALTLARARRIVAVFDEPDPPRNAASHALHGFLGLDHLPQDEVQRLAWEQINRYETARLQYLQVDDIRPAENGDFVLYTRMGVNFTARHVILATGYRDIFPDLPGFAQCWGASIIPCVLCDGYEHRDRAWGIVRASANAPTTDPRIARLWTNDLQFIQGGDAQIAAREMRQMDQLGVRFHRGAVTAIDFQDTQIQSVTLDSGAQIALQTLIWMPQREPVPLIATLAQSLQLALDPTGNVQANPTQRTNVDRLWAAGDILDWAGALGAARQGETAAQSIIHDWYQ